MTKEELEKEAKEWADKMYPCDGQAQRYLLMGAEFGYNKANEWFYAKRSIPVPKKAEIYRYTLEAISDKGDIVCYDYKDKDWKKLVIENEKVTYVPVEVERWCNKPTKETE